MSPADESILMDPSLPLPGQLQRLIWHDRPQELDQLLVQSQDVMIADKKEGHVPLIDSKFRGTTALGLAAQLGREKCIKVLLKHWADTLTASESGYYPLQEATSFGNRDIIRMLLLRRHEQLRQLWVVRQPVLVDALRHELPDFFLEMNWHFKSWIPFLSRFCPSDTCRIWKRGNQIRVDSTLKGIEMDKLNWVRGNISFIFTVSDCESQFFVLDHDKKLFEEIDKLREYTEEEIEEDINLRLNTQVYSGKVRKPKDPVNGEKKVVFKRQQTLFGLGGDREEEVGPYWTRVYDVPNIEVIGKYRREHLTARTGEDENNNNESDSSQLKGSSESEPNSLASDQVLQEIEGAEPKVTGMLEEARKNLFVHVPSLPPPPPHKITESKYFNPSEQSYIHLGRPMMQSEKSKKVNASVWMAENFPLTTTQLMPFLEIMTVGNKNFEKLQEFVSLELPPGFPVKIEIPLFAFLSAQITFLNFQNWTPKDEMPLPAFAAKDVNWFNVPKNYKPGVVIKNILKD